ncbi:MAG: complex I 51 kDa subunit family protein [Deltaproteobacteria bacterium]
MPEKRIVLKNCEVIDPGDIDTHLEGGGFKALAKALNDMTPDAVIEEVKLSGLRGRGGAGFLCGLKWEAARRTQADEKFLVCNADEGEMGTFKDRYIIQNDPFTLIEGMAIAGYAIGTRKAYVYLRGEYRPLIPVLRNGIDQAKGKGLLKGLNIEVREGAGAYVCGEESALMNSIEGGRGEARYRPPFPPMSGLFGKPTIINNVETLANVPQIILNGASWFSAIGTDKSKGTKVFSVSGDVKRPGIYELVMGSNLKELVFDKARARGVKAVQVGGAAGRIIPGSLIDTPLSFETVLGSGAVTVFDETRDIIDMIYRTAEFFAEESCGKCAPCREGTQVLIEILGKLARGEGSHGDMKILEDLSQIMMDSSLCGLGQSASIPVMDSLKYFRSDYENRINQSLYLKKLGVS